MFCCRDIPEKDSTLPQWVGEVTDLKQFDMHVTMLHAIRIVRAILPLSMF